MKAKRRVIVAYDFGKPRPTIDRLLKEIAEADFAHEQRLRRFQAAIGAMDARFWWLVWTMPRRSLYG
jgi:hypothetical protein